MMHVAIPGGGRTYSSKGASHYHPLDRPSRLRSPQSSQCPFSGGDDQVIFVLGSGKRKRAGNVQDVCAVLTCFRPPLVLL